MSLINIYRRLYKVLGEKIETMQKKSKFLWLLDNGHGGIIDGVYQTRGKRSPIWPDGNQLFEGEFNRAIVNRLIEMCNNANIDCVNIVPELEDIRLSERVRRANEIYKNDKRAVYVSIHANAGGGTGYELFTSPGNTKSDGIANIFFEKAEKAFPTFRMRGIKEANFYVLKNTHMPAILTENFFMDTLTPDCELLLSQTGRNRIARAHFEAIAEIENSKFFQ